MIAAHPARFGRCLLACPVATDASPAPFADDLRLFATSYALGFLFVAALIF